MNIANGYGFGFDHGYVDGCGIGSGEDSGYYDGMGTRYEKGNGLNHEYGDGSQAAFNTSNYSERVYLPFRMVMR